MKFSGDSEEKMDVTTSERSDEKSAQQQQDFFESEARRPMQTVTHQPDSSKGNNQFQPSSPTDRMLSPCSRKLMRRRSSAEDAAPGVRWDFWFPPPGLRLLLGSSSKSRALILQEQGWAFSTMSPDIDERAIQDNCQVSNIGLPVVIAKAKANAILQQLEQAGQDEEGTVVITSDQIVLFQNEVLSKPKDSAQAKAFLSSYQEGTACQTVTAVVATHVPSGRQDSQLDICTVHWSGIPPEAHARLLAKEDVYFSCGGFLIEDEDFLAYVDRIEGDLDSIRGLPVTATKKAIHAVAASPVSPVKR